MSRILVMYVIGNLYKSIKGIKTLTGITGSAITLTYGIIQSGGTIFIVGGALCMTTALFDIFELTKVTKDLDKEITDYQSYLDGYIGRINELYGECDINKRYTLYQTRENEQLRQLLEKSEYTINELKLLQNKILTAKNIIANEAKELRDENSFLVDELEQLRKEYEQERQSLQQNLSKLDSLVNK